MKKKKKLAPLLLCLFLGNIGVHDFYAGKTALGIVHVLLFVSGIWFALMGNLILSEGAMVGYLLLGANALFAVIEFFVILISPTYGDCEGW